MSEDLTFGLGLEQVEIALKRQTQSDSVERVLSMKAESALPKGENYLSTIYRISLRVVLGNGRTAKRSLVLKVVPREKGLSDLVTSMGVFKTETMMYTTVLREMEALMEEFGDTSDVLWCRLVHYEPYSSLLLEDLKASGFSTTRRQDCLDLEHSLLALRSLGRWHAMSKILEQRGIISRDDYKPYASIYDKNMVRYLMHHTLQTLAKAMEEHWAPEWYDVAQKLKVPCEVLEEKIMKLGEIDESRFNCLNHGDCWSNNMMFKYDWQNRPYTLRFVDYQIVHYNSFARDVVMILYHGVSSETRRDNLTKLCEAYYDSLQHHLSFYEFEGDLPTFEDIMTEVDRLQLIGLLEEITWRFFTNSDLLEPMNIDKIIATKGQEGMKIEAFKNQRVIDMVKDDIIILTEEHFKFWV